MVTAFLIGLIVALNPCQLAISTSALTFLSKDGKGGRSVWLNGIFYSFGRFLAYLLLGWACLFVNIAVNQQVVQIVERVLPYVLLLFGAFFILRAFFHHHHHHDSCHNSGFIIHRYGSLGAMLLGGLLAFAFCPESAVLFFGIVVPLSLSSAAGMTIAPAFALAAILPSLLLAYLLSRASELVARFQLRMERLQFWSNLLVGIVFVLIALLLVLL